MTELYLNPRLATIEPSAIRTMHERKRASSLDLGMGQPSLLPDPEPFARATQWVREHGCPYAPPAGEPELRERIARVYGGKHYGGAGNVCVTNGSQEGIYLAIKTLLEPQRDEVLLTEPSYPSYARACQLEGVQTQTVALSSADGFALRADVLLAALRPQTRIILFGSPANPTGAVMHKTEMQRLAHGLLARPGPPTYIVVDEVYRELTFTPEPYYSFMDLYPHTVALQSLSKSRALTGLRLGFLFGPPALVEAAIRAHGLMMMSVNTFAQRVALEILRTPDALRAHVPWYVQQRRLLLQAAQRDELHVVEPEGAFYCMLPLPPQFGSSEAAAHRLLAEHDVVTIPGSVFGPSSEGYLRLTWAAPPETVAAGLERIQAFLSTA